MKRFLLSAIAALALAGCAIPSGETTTFDQVKLSYETATQQVDVIAALPVCTAEVTTLCHRPANIEKMNYYLGIVGGQIELAQSQIDAGIDSEVAERRALTTLGTLFGLLAAQVLTNK